MSSSSISLQKASSGKKCGGGSGSVGSAGYANANNSSCASGRRKSSSSSSQLQKLRGTFGHSLNEKLHFPFTTPPGEVSSSSSDCVSNDSCIGSQQHASHHQHQSTSKILDAFKEEDEDEEEEEEEKSGMEIRNSSSAGKEIKDCGRVISEVVSSSPCEQHQNTRGVVLLLGEMSSQDKTPSKTSGTRIQQSYEIEDNLSMGYLSDLPSGLIDIEGNIIGDLDLKFGQEFDDEYSSVDECDKSEKYGDRYSQSESSSSRHKVRKDANRSNSRAEVNNDKSESETERNYLLRNTSNSQSGSSGNDDELCRSKSFFNRSRAGLPPQSRGKVLTRGQQVGGEVHRRRSRSPHAPLDRNHSSGATSSSSNTITQHYYPEGGWGFVVLVTASTCQTLLCGIQLSFGILMNPISDKFGEDLNSPSGWLGALSLGISLFLSPVWVSICKRKSTRLSAVFGGLVASLGCLFTSFASQFHQLFVSYGAFLGIGIGLTRDASTLMVGQYFKRKRDMVEIIVVAGSGLGIVVMSASIYAAVSSLGWRLGLQAITGSLFLTFFLSTCYRSASLYHPQRRAILHLKNQKRKVKEKEKREEKPPFIDYSCLRSKTVQILLLSSAFTALGMYNPLFSLALECSKKGFESCSLVLLHVYIGTAWIIGCCLFGLLVIQKSQDCRVSKQYLVQVAGIICGISILAFTAVKGASGMTIFCWVYGFSLGGYNYALKMYTYERVRARHFPRAWSFVQSVQAFPLLFGVPLSAQINQAFESRAGYYFSAVVIFIGSVCLFLTDVRKRKMSRRKESRNSSMKTCETTDGTQSPKSKQRLSFSFPIEQVPPQSKHNSDEEDEGGNAADQSAMMKELTCISEEGLADIDFQDIYFEEWAEYFGDCITSCGKVENCLVSEYDPDLAVLVERRARRWSTARQTLATGGGGANAGKLKAIGSPRAFLKPKTKGPGTILRVPMLNPKLFQLALGSRSQGQQQRPQEDTTSIEDEEEGAAAATASSSSPSGNRLRGARLAPMRAAVPFLRSHIMKGRGGRNRSPLGPGGQEPPAPHQPKPRSCSVIDEDSV